jgi:hypothetical protein
MWICEDANKITSWNTQHFGGGWLYSCLKKFSKYISDIYDMSLLEGSSTPTLYIEHTVAKVKVGGICFLKTSHTHMSARIFLSVTQRITSHRCEEWLQLANRFRNVNVSISGFKVNFPQSLLLRLRNAVECTAFLLHIWDVTDSYPSPQTMPRFFMLVFSSIT